MPLGIVFIVAGDGTAKKSNRSWETKGYGISGTVGAFAFSVIAGGLIGGIMLMIAVITVFANMVKMCLGKTRR